MTTRRAVSIALWIPVLLMSAMLSLVWFVVVSNAAWASGLAFLLALPVALVALAWTRLSAGGFVLLLIWDLLSSTWPHFFIDRSFFESRVDVMLVAATVLSIVIALLIPSGGLIGRSRSGASA
jgi:hypothetical protein